MAKDFYKTLGVRKNATDAQIKSSYRKLARKYHPDVNPGDKNAERLFKEISEAYSVLSDPDKRKKYDTYGTIDPSAYTSSQGGGFGFSGFDFSSAGSAPNFSDVFDEIFNRRGRAKKPHANAPRAGLDQQYVVNLSFMDAIRGITSEISVTRRESCGACRGRGHIATGGTQNCRVCGGSGRKIVQTGVLQFEKECYACGGSGIAAGEPCRNCHGTGTVPVTERITVRIPAGVDNGSRVRVPGKGDAGVNGGKNGDLYIITNVQPHPFFTRKGNNIYVQVPITVSEAALGGKLEVPTIDGTATIRIPPSTQSGQVFRLRERGVKALRGDARGDQFVEVRIVLPKVIDEGAKELYRKLERLEHWNPRKDLLSNL